MSDELTKIKVDLARGFAAMKVLLDERDQDIAQLRTELKEMGARLHSTDLKLAELATDHKNTKEQTGRFETVREDALKAQGAKETVDKVQTHQLEKLKATAPLWVAVVSGIFGLLAGIVSLISTLLSSH